MIKFNPQDFAPLLEKFEEPRGKKGVQPYVAFGRYLKEYRGRKIVPHLFVLNMAGAHAQKEQLEYYVEQKGFRPLKWFLPPDWQTVDGRTPFAELDKKCRAYVAQEEAATLKVELEAERAKSIGLEAALEEARAKIGAKK